MRQVKPLNEDLYYLLGEYVGKVSIVSQGVGMHGVIRLDPFAMGSRKGRMDRWKAIVPGEEYKVNCPFCADTRQRMFVNHRWGVQNDGKPGGKNNLWLVQCFNEQCMSDFNNRQHLYDMTYGNLGENRRPVRKGTKVQEQAGEVAPAGHFISSLEELAQREPDHVALAYLRDRGFDPIKLSRLYDAGYCDESRYSLAKGRIYIPVIQKLAGEPTLVGWQVRWPDDTFHGKSFKSSDIPKYWSCPGMNRGLMLYNLERAARHDVIVIVEGPTDVWRLGRYATALMGPKITPTQVKLLRTTIGKKRANRVTIIVLTDPEWPPGELKKPKEFRVHPLDASVAMLRDAFEGTTAQILGVYLPEGADPGSLESKLTRNYIREACKKEGVTVKFKPPRRKA